MVRYFTRPHFPTTLLALCVATAAACGSRLKTQAPAATPPVPVNVQTEPVQVVPPSPPTPVVDPVVTLIERADGHFKAGQRELALGHREAAKLQFDRAVDVLMESPYGGRTEPRIRDYFDRLIDRISAYEVKALADGDGFTEKKYAAATIDELLALSATFSTPTPDVELKQTVQSDLATAQHDIDIPLNQRVLAYIDVFQGRLHDFIADGMKRGSRYLPMIQNVFRAEGLPLD